MSDGRLLDGRVGTQTMLEETIERITPVTAYEILPFQEEIGTEYITNCAFFIPSSDNMSTYQFFWSARLSLPKSSFGGL
jgi:hypothetical protein